MYTALCRFGAVVHCGKFSFPWLNGVPSGWRWMALLDTLLNISSLRVILGYLRQMFQIPIEIPLFVAQGDDVLFA